MVILLQKSRGGEHVSRFEGPLPNQIMRFTKSPEPEHYLFVPFRVNSWIVLVQAGINTKPIKARLTRLISTAVLNRS